MLEIGKISYLLTEESDEIISTLYSSLDEEKVTWDVLHINDKEAFLRQSLAEIESLMFCGAKTNPNQTLSFPRNGVINVPDDVKTAQAENAIAIMKERLKARSDSQFKTLSSMGSMANVKYDRKKQDLGVVSMTAEAKATPKKMTSDRAYAMLRPYLGSFRIL